MRLRYSLRGIAAAALAMGLPLHWHAESSFSPPEAFHFLEGFYGIRPPPSYDLLSHALGLAFTSMQGGRQENFLVGFCSQLFQKQQLEEDRDEKDEGHILLNDILVQSSDHWMRLRILRLLLLAIALAKRPDLVEEHREAFNHDDEELVSLVLAKEQDLTELFNLSTRDTFEILAGVFAFTGNNVIVNELAGIAASFDRRVLLDDRLSPSEAMALFERGRQASAVLGDLAVRYEDVYTFLATRHSKDNNSAVSTIVETIAAHKS